MLKLPMPISTSREVETDRMYGLGRAWSREVSAIVAGTAQDARQPASK